MAKRTQLDDCKRVLVIINKRLALPAEPFHRNAGESAPVWHDGHLGIDGDNRKYRVEKILGTGGTSCPFGERRYGVADFHRHLLTILDTLDYVERLTGRQLVEGKEAK